MEEESPVIGESAPPTEQVKGDEHMARVCPAAAADGGYFPIPLNKEGEAARLISSHVRIGLARSLGRGRRALHVNCGCLSVCLSLGLSFRLSDDRLLPF